MNVEKQSIDPDQLADDSSAQTELRVNLVRISAIAVFYLVHLWHVSAPSMGEWATWLLGIDPDHSVNATLHISVTVLAAGWLLQALAIHLLIAGGQVSDRGVTFSTLADVGWLTAVLCLSTGPAGPMVAGYFLIVALAGLRFDLRLVRITTIAAVVGYIFLTGVARWPFGIVAEIGLHPVPRYHQLMTVLAIGFTGVIVGQIVRLAYRLPESFNNQLGSHEDE